MTVVKIKKAKDTKNCVIKREPKNCLEATQLENKTNYLFRKQLN